MGTTVFGENDKRLHFDLNTDDGYMRVRLDDEWRKMSIDEVYSEYSTELADKAIIEAIRYGQSDFKRQGDMIIMESRSFPSIRLECEISNKQYNDDGALANESLSTVISVKRDGRNVLLLNTSKNVIERPSASGKLSEVKSKTIPQIVNSFIRAKKNLSDTEPLF